MPRWRTYLLRFVLLIPFLGFITNAYGQESSVGREFIFAFQSNGGPGPSYRYVHIFKADPDFSGGTVTVTLSEFNATQTVEFDSPSLQGFLIPLDVFGEERTLDEGKDRSTITVTADFDVVVDGLNYALDAPNRHGDATSVFPTSTLGTSYYVMSYNEQPLRFGSQATVVATQNETYIDITPTANTRNHRAGETFTVMLNRGERYQIQSRGDLTGTYVTLNPTRNSECKPFAVFSGSVLSAVGLRTTEGHMYKQMYPLSVWGKRYALLPFGSSENQYRVRALAFENGTDVQVDGVNRASGLSAGEFFEFDASRPIELTSNKPVLVGQFYMGLSDDPDEKSDPFMLLPLALEHRTFNEVGRFNSGYLLPAFGDLGNVRQYQNVIVPTDEVSFLSHQGPNFQESFQAFPPDPSLSYTVYRTPSGFERMFDGGSSGHLSYNTMLGVGPVTVNASSTGNVRFERLDTLSISLPDLSADGLDLVCLGEAVNFRPSFSGRDAAQPVFDVFEWDFGDGTVASGDSVFHTYDAPGQYQVQLRATSDQGVCQRESTTVLDVTVVSSQVTAIDGPISICPNAEAIPYTATGVNTIGYEWLVEGGTIAEENDNQVLINWGEAMDNARVRVIGFNDLGCASDTLDLSVRINPELTPPLPIGNARVCFNELEQTYTTPNTPGSVYTWQVTGGELVSGQGTNVVVVNWTAQNGSLFFTESATTRTDVCDGDSPVLEVAIAPELILTAEQSNVTCFDADDGSLALTVLGGDAPYEVRWADGASSMERTGLTPGDYAVTITDALGCVLEATYTITEPELLEGDIETTNVSCFEGSDGLATALVTGGTAPYRYFWNGRTTAGTETLGGLAAGSYSLRVLNDQDCELLLNFEITQPEPLTATTTDSPACPGENNGSILVAAQGGTPPYTYRWNTSPPQDGELIQNLGAGIYSVTVTDANGCTFTFENEEVKERFPRVTMPNAFSPNGDDQNDTFFAVYDCNFAFDMKIYSTWGELIYQTDDINQGWDGRYRGEEAPVGKYVYVVTYTVNVNGQPFTEVERGSLRLFR